MALQTILSLLMLFFYYHLAKSDVQGLKPLLLLFDKEVQSVPTKQLFLIRVPFKMDF